VSNKKNGWKYFQPLMRPETKWLETLPTKFATLTHGWKYFQLFFQPHYGRRFQPFSETVGKIKLLNSQLFVKNSFKNGR